MTSILTVGHSTHPVGIFVSLLRQNGVTALADVRSSPYSRFNPQYNREALELELKGHGIKYVFLGRELGARSEDPTCYDHGRVQYGRLASTPLFQSGIERLMTGAETHRIAIMCAEKEPLECHRTLLVAQALAARGIDVEHILADGRIEKHQDTMERLLDVQRMPPEDMFTTRQELLERAISRQELKIAYVDQEIAADAAEKMP